MWTQNPLGLTELIAVTQLDGTLATAYESMQTQCQSPVYESGRWTAFEFQYTGDKKMRKKKETRGGKMHRMRI